MGTMLRIAILTVAMVCLTVVGHATTIEYTASQIAGTQWQYTYTVTGRSFADGDFLSIDFDANTFADLQNPPQVTDWDAIVFERSADLLSNGAFSAMALKDNPSLPVTFTVLFNFLGMGTPGSQAFSIFGSDGSMEDGTTILAGQTAPVPEPGTLLLLLSGAGALTRKFRKSA